VKIIIGNQKDKSKTYNNMKYYCFSFGVKDEELKKDRKIKDI
jgi:hypothetical protein